MVEYEYEYCPSGGVRVRRAKGAVRALRKWTVPVAPQPAFGTLLPCREKGQGLGLGLGRVLAGESWALVAQGHQGPGAMGMGGPQTGRLTQWLRLRLGWG